MDRNGQTWEQYARHAEKFGTECVVDTAMQEGMRAAPLIRLVLACDTLDAGLRNSRGHLVGRRPRRSAVFQAHAAALLREDGRTVEEMAELLGLSVRRVQDLKPLETMVSDGPKRLS